MTNNIAYFVCGNPILSSREIKRIKENIPEVSNWTEISADMVDAANTIRSEIGFFTIDGSCRGVFLFDIPNKKAIRDILVDIVGDLEDTCRVIIWDSEGHVKDTPSKDWFAFIASLKEKNVGVINCPYKFDHKTTREYAGFIKREFSAFDKIIDQTAISTLINIVGYNPGMMVSEIEKISLVAKDENIQENLVRAMAFPSNYDVELFRIYDALDKQNPQEAIGKLNEFLMKNVNENVMADTLLKYARNQMIAIDMLISGCGFNETQNALIELSKIPMPFMATKIVNKANMIISRGPTKERVREKAIADFLLAYDAISKIRTASYKMGSGFVRSVLYKVASSVSSFAS